MLGCTVIAIALTLFYIYPINDVLMTKGGNGLDAATIQHITARWLIADRLRFAIYFIGFILLLKTFRNQPAG